MVIKGLWKYYADELILENINATISKEDRIGLVGPNGIGKTTFLRIISGEEDYEHGTIIKNKEYIVGHQEQIVDEVELTIEEYLRSAFTSIIQLEAKLKDAESKLSLSQVNENEEKLKKAMDEYAAIQQEWEAQGGYEYQVEIKSCVLGLGFSEEELKKPLSTLSGGQKMRVQLGRVLLDKPDLLLLDEPTNHLDIDAVEWLETYLQNYPKALIVVSHDRYFLNKVVNQIWEIQDKQLYQYKGNYTKFQQQRELRIKQLEESKEKQQEEIAKMEGFIRKFGAGTRARQAKSLQKKLEKIDPVKSLSAEPKMEINIKPKRRSGNKVAVIENVFKEYDKPVLAGVNGEIKSGDRIALVGPNGSGKTTLLKILVGAISYSGSITLGTGVDIGYFTQQIEFEHNGSVLDELYETFRLDLGQLRSVLARFLFKEEDVFKSINVLSGGEKNRLSLAKLLLQKPNFLILDEPTNYLDIYAKEELEQAFLEFGGTMIFVSHDRYLIDSLSTKIWAMQDGKIKEFDSYSEYREHYQDVIWQRKLHKKQTHQNKKTGNKNELSSNARRQLEIKQAELEKQIQVLEEQKQELEVRLASPGLYQDDDEAKVTVLEYQNLENKLEEYYQEWEGLLNKG